MLDKKAKTVKFVNRIKPKDLFLMFCIIEGQLPSFR